QIQQDMKELIDKAVEDELGPAVLASLKSTPEQEEALDPEQPIDRLIARAFELWKEGWRAEAERHFRTIEKNIIPSIADEASQHIASIASQDVFDPIALSILQDQAWMKLAEVYWKEELWIDAELEIAQIHDEHKRYETSILYAEAFIQKVNWQDVKHLFGN